MMWPAALLPALFRRRCSGPTAGHQGEDAADAASVQEEDVEEGKGWKEDEDDDVPVMVEEDTKDDAGC